MTNNKNKLIDNSADDPGSVLDGPTEPGEQDPERTPGRVLVEIAGELLAQLGWHYYDPGGEYSHRLVGLVLPPNGRLQCIGCRVIEHTGQPAQAIFRFWYWHAVFQKDYTEGPATVYITNTLDGGISSWTIEPFSTTEAKERYLFSVGPMPESLTARQKFLDDLAAGTLPVEIQ